MRGSIKNNKNKKKNAEKTAPLSGLSLSEPPAALFSCFHRLSGDLATTAAAQRNAGERDTSVHKPEASRVFTVFLLTAEECL